LKQRLFENIQQIEAVICHDTFMRYAHAVIVAVMFHVMHNVHGWSEESLLVGM